MEAARSRPGKLAPGSRLGDTYEIVRLVGEGGMGEVYEVKHARLSGRYALKIIRKEMIALTSTAVRRFQREAEVTSSLRHPNIVQIIDFNQAPDGSPYFVMEFLEGTDLETRMRQRGPLPPSESLPIVEQIASALAAAHGHGVVHRDLKPQNVFLVPIQAPLTGQPSEFVKVLDFGISKVKTAESLTGSPVIMGTPHYMAPEQARAAGEEIDGRADQFALAAMLYELLAGRRAFPGDNVTAVIYNVTMEQPASLTPVVGPAVDAVLRIAMSKDRASRYPTIQAFATALRAAISKSGALSATGTGARSGEAVPRTYEEPVNQVAVSPETASYPPMRPPGHAHGHGHGHGHAPSAATVVAPRRSRRGLVAGLALVLAVAAAAAGALGYKRLFPAAGGDAALAAAGRSLRAAGERSLAAERQALAAALARATEVPELRNAVGSSIDAFTFSDLFENEDWWAPYKGLSAVVFEGDRARASRGVPDMVDAEAWKFWKAGGARPSEALLRGTERTYLAAGAAFGPGADKGVAAGRTFALVFAQPLDKRALAVMAQRAGADGALLTEGKRVIASSWGYGEPGHGPAGTEALPGRESEGAVALPGEGVAAPVPVGQGVWLWLVRDRKPPVSGR